MDGIRINKETVIPESEIDFEFSHSGGPGGQHVNKTATQVTLCFSVNDSVHLRPDQKQRLRRRLSNRINRDGILRVSSSDTRSQSTNREKAVNRFRSLLAEALKRPRRRKPTRPTRASQERRIEAKKRRGRRKAERRRRDWD